MQQQPAALPHGDSIYGSNSSFISAALRFENSSVLKRDCSPVDKVRSFLRNEKSFENNRITALLALPSRGGADIATFNESP
jgi:hypothetical protein